MRRRRSRLGSTAAEHSARATAYAYAHDTIESSKRATRAAAKGQCAVAFHEVTVMNRQWGATLHEHKGAGWARKFPRNVEQRVNAAEKVFSLNCVAPARAPRPSGPPRLTVVNGARRRR